MLGLFLASLGLSTAVAITALLAPTSPAQGCAMHAADRMRFWTFYLALFGLIGVPLTLLGLAMPVPAAVALTSAAVLARGLSQFFHETSADIGLARLVGTEARVLIPVGAQAGKVVVQTHADRIELPARSDDGNRIERGARVLVSFIEDGVAAVTYLDPRLRR